MIQLRVFLVLFLLVCFGCVYGLNVSKSQDSTVITIDTVNDIYRDTIEHECAQPFRVKTLHVEADAFIQQDEMGYLIGFKEGDVITAEILNKALYYLIKKNVFETIMISLRRGDDGCDLSFKMKAFWTLDSIKIYGIWFGKDAYRQQYGIDVGEPFDSAKHKDSLERMRELIESDGYFNNKIEDRLVYDEKTKGVAVQLTIKKGKRFTCAKVNVRVEADKSLGAYELENTRSEIHCFLAKHVAGKHYSKHLVNQVTVSLKQMLLRRGFIHADVNLTEVIDYGAQEVKSTFFIDLHAKKEFIFFGNSFFSDKQLFETILAFGRSAWMVPPSILAQDIETAYQNNGFWGVQVDSKEEQGRIFFVIKEGPRSAVREVVLKNVVHFSPHELVQRYFNQVVSSQYFSESILQKSRDELVAFYQDEGFFDAAVVEREKIEMDSANTYRLILTVDEGARRFIRSVRFDSFGALRAACPRVEDIDAQKYVPCTRSLIDKQRQWIEAQLKALGYSKAQCRAELIADGASIDVVWHIDVTADAQICGKTVLMGTRTVPFSVVQRELAYRDGDALKKDSFKKSLLNIKSLDIFDSANIYPDQTHDLGVECPIVLQAYPGDRFELRTRVGIGLQQMRWPVTLDALTYKVGGLCLVKNPTNCGDQFRLDVDVTRVRSNIVASYKRPWLFGLPVRFSCDMYSNRFAQQGLFCDRENWYQVVQQGFLVNLSGQYGHVGYSGNCGVEWMNMNITDKYTRIKGRIADAYNIDTGLLDRHIPYFFIEPTLIVDYLDEKLNPSSGSFTLLSCKGMVPLSGPSRINPVFCRCLVEQTLYKTFHSIVFVARLRAGYIFGAALRQVMLNERYYLGGAHSLRSYYTDGTPPLGSFLDECNVRHYVPQGGRAMLNACFEARIPLYAGLKGVVFQDFGMLRTAGYADAKACDVLAGTGFGLVYNTPMGPLRFDIGWKWRCPEPFNRSYAWFLSLGQIF
jgi:outer membrane protein assembly factor BamA